MADGPILARLIRELAEETSYDRSLDALARWALTLTESRHSLIATMNDEVGCLELLHTAGDETGEKEPGRLRRVTVGGDRGIVGHVAATGEPYVTGNVRNDPLYQNYFETTLSEIAVPVRDRHGRIRAVLNVESDREDWYGEAALDTCRAIANLIALVLDQEEHRRREEALMQIGRSLSSALTEEGLIDHVIHVAGEVLRFQACSIFLLDEATDEFVLRGSTSHLKKRIGEVRYGRGEGCTGWVCDHAEAVLLQDPHTDPRWRGRYLEIPGDQIASFLAVPIVAGHQGIGAIRVIRRVADNPYLDNRFTPSDQRLLEAIAQQLATGLRLIQSMERVIRSERMIAWGELSAKSSHMIGNRVFAIKGDVNELGHLLSAEKPDPAALRRIQESLQVNLMRTEEILQDFRDFVSATQLKLEPGDVNEVVRETVAEVFPKRSSVKLDLELGEVPETRIDAKKLRRAVSELIENSLSQDSTGTLRVATGVIRDSERFKRPAVRIEVEDSGGGVPDEKKESIFQPFHSGRVRGMGLGLSIVKGIVDAHGGTVYEDGTAGKGAKFVILLPLANRP